MKGCSLTFAELDREELGICVDWKVADGETVLGCEVLVLVE